MRTAEWTRSVGGRANRLFATNKIAYSNLHTYDLQTPSFDPSNVLYVCIVVNTYIRVQYPRASAQ